jgi:PhnB protein
MNSLLNPYIHFKDNARQAMEFYQSVFGGELAINTFAEFHATEDPADAYKIMHAMLEAENGITLMASDTPSFMKYNPGSSVTISLSGDNDAELTGYFNKLAQDGTVEVPLEKAPWGDKYGQLTDKFGIEWMVNVTPAKE